MSENHVVYLDNAASNIYSPKVLACAEEFVSLLRDERPEIHAKNCEIMQGYIRGAREKVAELIHCDASEITLIESTTHALGLVSELVDIKSDENVLICDLEYGASYFCLTRKQKKNGFEIRQVKSENNEITADIFKKYIDDKTRLIILSAVQEVNGYRADLKAISDLAHRYGAYFAVDGVQEVGAMDVNVREAGVDFYGAGAKKWLGSPFGTGFLYIRDELVHKLEPAYDSYFNALLPGKGWPENVAYMNDEWLSWPGKTPFDQMDIIDTAQKFEINGYRNYLGALGLMRAVELHLEYGQKNIEEKIISLNIKLTEGLRRLGLDTVSSKVRRHMSSSVSFNFGLKDGEAKDEIALVEYLRGKNILVSCRCSTGTGGVRVSMQYYTTEEDIDAFLSAVKDFLSERMK